MGVAINVCAPELKMAGFRQLVVGILAQTRLALTRLELEITETTLLDNNKAVRGSAARAWRPHCFG